MNQCTRNQIVLHFKTHIQNAQVALIKENKKISRVYFINKGNIAVLKGKKAICQLKDGQAFGLLGLMNQYSEYAYEIAIDSDYAHLFSISLRDLASIMSYDTISYQLMMSKEFEIDQSFKQRVNSLKGYDQLLISKHYSFNESIETISTIYDDIK